jgi:hypothetical protein
VRATSFLIALSLVILSPKPAIACDCAGPGDACSSFWSATAVFSARVVRIEPTDESIRRVGHFRVTLQVIEPFRGAPQSEAVVFTNAGPTSCGFPFELNQSYLVFAVSGPRGFLVTSSCSLTRRLDAAGEPLAYARRAKAIRPNARGDIKGSLEMVDAAGTTVRLPERMQVTAAGSPGRFTASVGSDGRFAIANLPRGDYQVSLSAPAGYESEIEDVAVNDPAGCGEVFLWMYFGGRVPGRVVNDRGEPIAGLPLQLFLAGTFDRPAAMFGRPTTRTAADGTYTFERVPPGDFLLGMQRTFEGEDILPRAFFPFATDVAAAEAILVTVNAPLPVRDFVLPAGSRIVTLRGTVRDERGRLLGGAEIQIHGRQGEMGTLVRTNGDGRFAFAVVAGERYTVRGIRHYPDTGPTELTLYAAADITATFSPDELQLVLKQQ